MKTKLVSLLVLATLLGCNSVSLRKDSSLAPSDNSVQEARLEFNGCGKTSSIGTLLCGPADTDVGIVTEFVGDVVAFSGTPPGTLQSPVPVDCSFRQELAATPPLTHISLPAFKSICNVTVYYLPSYPGVSATTNTVVIEGLLGQIRREPDPTVVLGGTYSITQSQLLPLIFTTDFIRGVWLSDQYPGSTASAPVTSSLIKEFLTPNTIPAAQQFTGDSFTYQPILLGFDLIQVKLFRADGTSQLEDILLNIYNPLALQLLVSVSTKNPGKSNATLHLVFPNIVSFVSANGSQTQQLTWDLPLTYTGFVRAYSANGRTAVLNFNNGILESAL